MRDASRFDPGSIETFRVTDWDFDPGTSSLRLRYALCGLDGRPRISFEEQVVFGAAESRPTGAWRTGSEVPPAFERAVELLHLASGVSYYKAAAPRFVVVERPVTTEELAVARLLYDDGLREFAVANGLGVPLDVEIGGTDAEIGVPLDVEIGGTGTGAGAGFVPAGTSRSGPPGGRVLVPVGGGKDSFVLAEALRPLDPLLFAVNPKPFVVAAAREAGFDLVVARRALDPQLVDLNRRGARNGHVPITAIVSLLAVATATLVGSDRVVLAVERSASEETTVVDGVPVNHQFSKSLVFERALAALVAQRVDPSLRYGSGLRPYSELAIARAFAGMDRYHHRFVSCNAAYRLDAAGPPTWCGACPKCRFVALALAPFLGREAVAGIVGRDLFAEPEQIDGFAALFDAEKPYECVGERRESAVALVALADRPEWRDAPVVAALADRARALVTPGDLERVLAPEPQLAYPDAEVAAAVAAVVDRAPVPPR
ncbi:MAG: hypothetical protein ACP5P9_05695 [Acidimicrobiales bacterium]